jgi:hypothetical protein
MVKPNIEKSAYKISELECLIMVKKMLRTTKTVGAYAWELYTHFCLSMVITIFAGIWAYGYFKLLEFITS